MAINIDLNTPPPNSYSEEEHNEFPNQIHLNTDNNTEPTNEEPNMRAGSKRRFLNNEQRASISRILIQCTNHRRLKKGTTKTVATLYSVSCSVIERIWKQIRREGEASHKKTKNCGRKRIDFDQSHFSAIPLSKRTTLRSLAFATKINKTSLFRLKKNGAIRRHSNAMKPFLKEENKVARLKFCVSMLERGSMPHDPTFISMHNIVHIDEKWFYMTKKSNNYYLLPEEEEPLRTCKSKNFIGKVMFLTAVAHPRFDSQGNELFSGKTGLFPFVTYEAAKRSSVNKPAGTLETKPIISVDSEVSKRFLIEKVIPAIKAKWPRQELHDVIYIQQDNARTHIKHDDAEFCQVASEDGFQIRLMCQPANSPYLNVLDLGFFNAIQSLQHKEAPKNVDELINVVDKAFEDFPSVDCNNIFLTLQSCIIEIMKRKGCNNYNIPHIKKGVMQKEGCLPTKFKCDPSLVEEVLSYLRSIRGS